jgi:ribose 5-phosphate isomerase A
LSGQRPDGGREQNLEPLVTRALDDVRPGMLLGLGSGRAASAFVRALGQRVRAGLDVRGVPTSEATARVAREHGVALAELTEQPIDLAVDGADEVDPRLDLIKGYGGALLRERVVAAAARRLLILVEADKLVPVLGSRGRLPLEVVPFAAMFVAGRLRRLGLSAELRQSSGRPLSTDNGNVILDCAVSPLPEPAALAARLLAIPGVVDTGLFLGLAETVLVAEGGSVRVLTRR